MTSARRLWLAFAPGALAAGGLTIALGVSTDHLNDPVVDSLLRVLVGWSFIAAGLVAWSRQPENRTGRLLLAVGFTWFLGSLVTANGSIPFTMGAALEAVFLAFFVHLLVAFPSGELASRGERLVVGSAYVIALAANVSALLLEPRLDFCDGPCPRSAIFVDRNAALDTALTVLWDVAGVAIGVFVVVTLVRRWRAASPAARRALTPVLLSGGTTFVLLVGNFATDFSPAVKNVFNTLALFAFISVPYAFLVGLLRMRLARAGVARLPVDVPDEATAEELRDALRRRLRDPGLEILHWLPERQQYVDLAGDPIDVGASDRVATPIETDAGPVGALLHDPSLLQERGLLEAAAASARVSLQKDRLRAELSARLVELERERDFVRTVVDSSPALFCVIEPNGRVVRFNQAAERLSCRPDDERARGRFFWELFLAPADHAAARQTLAIAQEGLVTGQRESGWVAADGGEHVVIWSLVPLVDADGEPRFLLTGGDITARKRQEQELEVTSARNRALLDAIPDLMFRIRRNGLYVDYHAHAGNLLLSPEVVGRTVDDRLPSRVAASVMAAVRRALDEGGVQTVEYELSIGGAERRYEARIVASGDDEVVSIVRDITDRKRQEEEVRRSRARIVEAADAERRRLERNLHDGAQQRLVSLSLALRLAQAKLSADPDAAHGLLGGAADELAQALEDLRELARGIHPAVLTDRGLAAALEALAVRAPLPVEVEAVPEERLPGPVEAAAYYVIAEGVTNVVKYASASAVRVSVERRNGVACVRVADDGVGGADPSRGTGLRGLADRVEALDGRLEVESPPGAGTVLRAEIPVSAVE